MEHVTVGGASIPAVGLGTSRLAGAEAVDTVGTALEMGYRHVDTAQYYGNEREIGDALEASSVDRDEVFLTTKVWRSNLRHDDVLSSVADSLDRLGVEYVDLLLIHWPHPRVPVAETLDAMEQLRAEGVVRHVGVSNFTAAQLREALDAARSPLVADQVLYHPFKDQTAVHQACVENDVALTAYSPLAKGAVVDDDVLVEIGSRHEKTAAQVALRWLVQQENVVAIPRSSDETHLAENLAVFDFELDDDEMARIAGLDAGFGMQLRNVLPSLVRSFPL